MFIKEALAQTTNMAEQMSGQSSMISSMLPLFLILLVFYIFVIRPQNKRAEQQSLMLSNLKKGDKVVTYGGIIGKITKIINDAEISLEIAEGVNVTLKRSAIVSIKNLDDVNKNV